jgi:hypothetical protein
VRTGSSPDNDGTDRYCQTVWVRLARREGIREEPVCKAPKDDHQLEPDGCGLGCGAYPQVRGTPGPILCVGREAVVNACGVATARPQGQSWVPNPLNGS